jgi:hypothetical protein
MESTAAETWAFETFSRARLPDQRLVARLCVMATAVASRPDGLITSTMKSSAEKEGAFRFVENDRVDPSTITEAMCESTALACDELPLVFVPIDQTDLTFTDSKKIRGLGPNGAGSESALRATQVMTALALDERGVPVGLLDQQWWCRFDEKVPAAEHDKRSPEEKESWWWLQTHREVHRRMQQLAPDTKVWSVCDRGADYGLFLKEAVDRKQLITVRAAQDRVIKRENRAARLFSTLRRSPVLERLKLKIPRGPKRSARLAELEVRAVSNVKVRTHRYGPWVELSAIQVRECSRPPAGESPIVWRLLTTHPVELVSDAMLVLQSYVYRWRVEEFHKTWKSGACNVERSQLRSYAAIRRWATILAAVAARVERLKRLARETPDVDALTEFTQDELDAAIYYMEPKQWRPGDSMTLHEAVRLVALAGGYMGRKGDGPPGSITIRRGLERILPAAAVLRAQRSG